MSSGSRDLDETERLIIRQRARIAELEAEVAGLNLRVELERLRAKKAVGDETEACAKVAEAEVSDAPNDSWEMCAEVIASAIRARGAK